jgi:hypothetical protein
VRTTHVVEFRSHRARRPARARIAGVLSLVAALAATTATAAAATATTASSSTGGTAAPAAAGASQPAHAYSSNRSSRGYRVPMSRRERRTLDTIARCESGSNPHAVSKPRGLYRGLYQFDRRTWRAMGGTGDPAQAPVWMQDVIALKLLRQEGLRPWPTCGAASRAYHGR